MEHTTESLTRAVTAMMDRMDDHDLLIRLNTLMDGVRSDMAEVKTSYAIRLQALEDKQERIATRVNIGIGICTAVSFVLPIVIQLFHK